MPQAEKVPEAPPAGLPLPESPHAERAIPPLPPTRPKFVPPPPKAPGPTPAPPRRAPQLAAVPPARPAPAPARPPAPPATTPTRRSSAPRPGTSGARRLSSPAVYAEAALGNRPPVYPPIARQNGWEGHVLLRAHILADGSLDELKVEQSSGYDILDQAALSAVERWRFKPARKDGDAVPSELDLGFTFRLTNGG